MKLHSRLRAICFAALVVVYSGIAGASAKLPDVKGQPSDTTYAVLYGPVTTKAADQLIARIHELQAVDRDEPIVLVINSPGGSVFDGMRVIDAMLASKRPVITVDVGLAASMAAIIHSFGAKRFMTPFAVLMYHNISSGYSGEVNQIQSQLALIQKIADRFEKNIAVRSKDITVSELEQHERDQWWVLSDEAMDRGLADGVVLLKDYPVPSE